MPVWEAPLNNLVFSSAWSWFWFSPKYWVFTAWLSPFTCTPSKRSVEASYYLPWLQARHVACNQQRSPTTIMLQNLFRHILLNHVTPCIPNLITILAHLCASPCNIILKKRKIDIFSVRTFNHATHYLSQIAWLYRRCCDRKVRFLFLISRHTDAWQYISMLWCMKKRMYSEKKNESVESKSRQGNIHIHI